MPQKRNPVGAAIALAAAVRVPGPRVDDADARRCRSTSAASATGPPNGTTLPDIALLAAGALDAMVEVVEGLDVDAAACARISTSRRGLIFAEAVQMALAPKIGRDAAHSLVAGACRRASAEHAHLREILAQEPKVTQVLDAQAARATVRSRCDYLGATHAFIERVLAGHPAPAD